MYNTYILIILNCCIKNATVKSYYLAISIFRHRPFQIYTLTLMTFSRSNCIKSNKNTILNYVLTDFTTVDISLFNNPIMSIDVFHSIVTFTRHHVLAFMLYYLLFFDYTYNWHARDNI